MTDAGTAPASLSARLQVMAGAAVDVARQRGHVGGEGEAKAALRRVIVRQKPDTFAAALAVCVSHLLNSVRQCCDM